MSVPARAWRPHRWQVISACLAAVTAALGLVGWGALGAWEGLSGNPGNTVTAETTAAVVVGSTHCSGSTPPYRSCAATSGDVLLSWSPVAGSPGLTVYRATAPGGPFSQIATLAGSATSYTDTTAVDNIQYYYQVVSEAAPGWPPGTDTDMALSLPPTGGADATGNASVTFTAADLGAMAVAGDGSTYTTSAGWGGGNPLGNAAIYAASCVSATQCWVAGAGGAVWTSADGGIKWTQQLVPGNPTLHGLRCVSASQCWGVGQGGTIVATSDGGATWSGQTSGTGRNLASISCPNGTQCWAVGQHGTILATTDGGSTWTAETSGTRTNLLGVSCPNATQCWAVGQRGTILATTDGGSTWSAEASRTGQNLDAVRFVSASDGWAVGTGGIVLVTTDGGSTWTTENSGTTSNLLAVKMVDPTTGWAVGAAGIVLHTTDGGATWAVQTSGTTESINAVGAGSTLNALVGLTPARGGPSVLVTADGGTTWYPPSNQYVAWTLSPVVASGAPVTSAVVTLVDQATAAPNAATQTFLLVSDDSGSSWTPIQIANPSTTAATQVVAVGSIIDSAAAVSGLELRYVVSDSNGFKSTFDLVHVDVN